MNRTDLKQISQQAYVGKETAQGIMLIHLSWTGEKA
jgi:hypothetical protein